MILQLQEKNNTTWSSNRFCVVDSNRCYTTVRHHPYHLVDPSPWPILTSLSALWLAIGLVLYFHQYALGGTVLCGALVCLVYMASCWWRDCMREAGTGYHTSKVKAGLNLGMAIFILSEAMFFVGLLWRFLNRALMPTVQIGMSWPPLGILPVRVDTWHARPILNTWLLLASYFTANNAKHALDVGDRQRSALFLVLTIVLAVVFTYYQYLEFSDTAFTFSDSVFGSSFFIVTGTHGIHVFFGTLYLLVVLFTLNSSKPGHSTAMNLSILYWHFVDLIWVFVLTLLYFWGGAVPSSGMELCADGPCVLEALLHEARLDAFEHNGELSLSVIFNYK